MPDLVAVVRYRSMTSDRPRNPRLNTGAGMVFAFAIPPAVAVAVTVMADRRY